MAHHFMLPSDSWEPNSSGEPTSSAEDGAFPQEKTLSIDRLAILLSPSRQTDDLARDLQLNEIVIQACLATGATGAAIALARGDEFICRASTGNTAPDLGMKLNIDQGLSAFCIHTGEVQRCDDSDTDARVDAEVCRHLGVRSVLVVPIVYSEYFLGIFEIFSPDPFAFADRDIQTIMALSKSVLKTLGIEPLEEHRTAISEGDLKATEVEIQSPPIEINLPRQAVGKFLAGYGNEPEDNPVPIPQPPLENVPTGVLVPEKIEKKSEPEVNADEPKTPRAEETQAHPEPFYPQFKVVQKAPSDSWTAVLTVLVVGVALVLGWVIGRGRFGRQNAAREQLRAAVAAQELKSPVAGTSENTNETKPAELTPITPSPKASPSAKKPVAADASNQDGDGLVVYQQGKVIYRQGTAPHSVELQNQPAQPDAEPASPPPQELTPEVAETLIKERVEPNYPERARRQNIEGPVVLDALVNEDGTVQRLKVVNGNSDLAAAAIEAVRRWRFKPYAVKGKAVQFATRITVNFDLPEPVSN